MTLFLVENCLHQTMEKGVCGKPKCFFFFFFVPLPWKMRYSLSTEMLWKGRMFFLRKSFSIIWCKRFSARESIKASAIFCGWSLVFSPFFGSGVVRKKLTFPRKRQWNFFCLYSPIGNTLSVESWKIVLVPMENRSHQTIEKLFCGKNVPFSTLF